MLFLVPIFTILVALEYTLESVPNSYRYKEQVFPEKYAHVVKILSFGSSHGYFNIRTSCFEKPAFNMGFPTQSLKYDYYLFNKYIDMCDSLQYVILPISYNLFRDEIENGPEWSRVKGYCMYMGCEYHKGEPRYNYELFGNFNTTMLSTVYNAWCGNENHISCDSLGWGSGYLYCNRPANWEHYGNLASGHTIANRDYVNQNTAYLESIINTCKKRDIKVLLLTTPTWHTYYENLESGQYEEMQLICNSMARKYPNVRYINMIKDERFTERDFYDADHLDTYGADKLTRMLNDQIEAWK